MRRKPSQQQGLRTTGQRAVEASTRAQAAGLRRRSCCAMANDLYRGHVFAVRGRAGLSEVIQSVSSAPPLRSDSRDRQPQQWHTCNRVLILRALPIEPGTLTPREFWLSQSSRERSTKAVRNPVDNPARVKSRSGNHARTALGQSLGNCMAPDAPAAQLQRSRLNARTTIATHGTGGRSRARGEQDSGLLNPTSGSVQRREECQHGSVVRAITRRFPLGGSDGEHGSLGSRGAVVIQCRNVEGLQPLAGR